MRLHTREQAPREGQAPAEPRAPYTPTRADYLAFLVDSLRVFEAFEEIVNDMVTKQEGSNDKTAILIKSLQNTGLERTQGLRQDIDWMVKEYGLTRPEVGVPGREYAKHLHEVSSSLPRFMCHFYNFYFAHTAGGRMIGKQMSALLLDKKTLEFYQVSRVFCVMTMVVAVVAAITMVLMR
jgi:heme oxygenase (biliverdin-producing, ferredoxin)